MASKPMPLFGFCCEVEHDTSVLRSLRIGDFLYSISDNIIKVNTLENPANEVASLQINDPGSGDPGDGGGVVPL